MNMGGWAVLSAGIVGIVLLAVGALIEPMGLALDPFGAVLPPIGDLGSLGRAFIAFGLTLITVTIGFFIVATVSE
ncbi:MAG: hypothetical protein V3U17_00925 [Thermoplasmata archaeon]